MKINIRCSIVIVLALLPVLSCLGQGTKSGRLDMTPGFSRFAKDYVETHINEWQKKGEFEKSNEYTARINKERDAMIKQFTDEALSMYIKAYSTPVIKDDLELMQYNADNEAFTVSHPEYGDLIVHISVNDAPTFKAAWQQMSVVPHYVLDGDYLVLESADFNIMKKGKIKKTYTGIAGGEVHSNVPNVTYSFAPIEMPNSSETSKTPKINTSIAQNFPQDNIDINVPIAKTSNNDKTFAVVIANENYRRVSRVDYAHNDGNAIYNYLVTMLGVPSSQIHFVKDATLNDMRGELEWIEEVSKAYKGGASFIFYYAGHGIPDESSGEGYLMPTDGFETRITSTLPLSELTRTMSDIESKMSVVILDACFSGAARSGDMLASARSVAIKTKPNRPSGGNVIYITASKDDEIASKLDEAQHGLFTYYLLHRLKATKGDITLGDLTEYVTDQVNRTSIVYNRKSQTPSVLVSQNLYNKWQNIKLTELSR